VGGTLYWLTGYSLAKKIRFWREINPPPLKQYSFSSEQVVANKYFHHKEKVMVFWSDELGLRNPKLQIHFLNKHMFWFYV
jgi:hypothetical protein